MDCSIPGFPVHHQLLELTQTHLHRVSDAIQPSHPLLSPSPSAFSLSQHQELFQWVSSSHQVAKVLEFQLQLSPSNEYSGLISFRMDWFGLLAVQGSLTSLLQHHSSKASILWRSAFLIVQLSPPYMTIGKTVALTRWTFVSKVMSLLFNMLSVGHSFSSKEQPSFNFVAAVTIYSDFGGPPPQKKIKSVTVSFVSSSICHEVMGRMPWSSFSKCSVLSQVYYSPFSLSSRGSLVLCFLL